MFYRPLLLISIVISGLCCWAQSAAFNDPISSGPFHSNLTGYVHDSAGQPINGARIDVFDASNGHNIASTYTMANGFYEINNLRHATYDIVASSGVTEQRNQFELVGDSDLSFRLPLTTSATNIGNTSVSLSQMNVPGKARRMLQKAEAAFHKARIDEAFGFVQKALGIFPDYAKALTLRGILKMQKGDNEDAQPDLERAVQLDYGDNLSFIALASLYNNEGQFDRAQQTLEHGLTLNPRSWQAGMEMARAQIGRQEYGAAIRSLDRAQPLAPPTMSIMHLFRAQALIGLRDYAHAGTELQTYLAKEPAGPNSNQARTILAQLREAAESATK